MAVFSAFVSLVTTAVGALFAGGAFATFVVNTLAQIGVSILVGLLMKKDAPEVFGSSGKLKTGDDVPRSFPVGIGFTEGSLVYASYWGRSGEIQNAYFTQVIALSDVPIKGMLAVTVDGVYCTPNDDPDATVGLRPSFLEMVSGAISSWGGGGFFGVRPGLPDPEDFGMPLMEYRNGRKDHAWVKFYDGTQTAADPLLLEFAQHPENPWTADHIGTGVAYAICTTRVNNKLFSGFPRFGFVLDSARLYNPAKDSSVGGNGPHRWEDRSTWGGEGDYLPMVQAYNVLRGISYGGRWLYGFQGVGPGRLPVADWIREIQKCAEEVPTPEGPRLAYRSGGILPVNAEAGDALQAIVASCAGRIAEIGGIYKPLAARPNAPVMHVDEADIIASEGHGFTPITRLADRINSITAQYPSPEEGFAMKVAEPIFRPDLEAEDGGRRLPSDLSLANVPYADQVTRLMHIALSEARRDRRHAFVLPPRFYRLEPLDTITFTSTSRGYENKTFLVQSVAIRADCHVMVEIVELEPADYDFSEFDGYAEPTASFAEPLTPVSAGLVDLSVAAAALMDASGTERRPAIVLEWDADQARHFSAVVAEVRVKGSSAVAFRATTAQLDAPFWIVDGILPSTEYEVRAAPVWNGEAVFTPWLDVTTPDVRLGEVDLSDDLRSQLAAAEATQAAVDMLDAEAAALQRETAALRADVTASFAQIPRITDAALSDIVHLHRESLARVEDTAVVRQEYHALVDEERVARASLRTELSAAIDANAASLVQESLVRASETEALAGQVSALVSTVGENTAAITEESAARANADSALASQVNTVQAATNANAAAITAETAARANADSALASQVNTVQAATNANAAAITAETAARANADSALAANIATVSAAVGGVQAAVTTQATAIADLNGRAAASLVLRARAGGAAGEIEVVAAADPTGAPVSSVTINSDRFKFTGSLAEFLGTVKITAAVIGDLEVERVKIAAGAVTSFNLISAPVTFTGATTWGVDALIGEHNITLSSTPALVPERIILRPRLNEFLPVIDALASGQFGCFYRIIIRRNRGGVFTTLANYIEPFWQFVASGADMTQVLYAGSRPSAVVQITQAGSYQPGDILNVQYFYQRFRTGTSLSARVDITGYSLEIEEYFR